MTKTEALAVEIVSIPGMSRRACNRLTRHYWGRDWWVEGSEDPEDGHPLSEEERKDRIKNDPPTLGDIIQISPWTVPARPLFEFAIQHGLTRVDWHGMLYDEEAVMTQLRRMDRQEIRALPLPVFGFFNQASRWVYGIAGPGKDMTDVTIGQFLNSKREAVDSVDRGLPSFMRLVQLLQTLGFTGEILESGRDYLIRSVRKKHKLSLKHASQVVDIAINEGWLTKIQLL